MRSFLNQVLEFVCAEHGVTVEELRSRTLAHAISHPRQEVMFMLQFGGWSSQRAAEALSRTDHTTALHAKNAVMERCADNADRLRGVVEEIRAGVQPEPTLRTPIKGRRTTDLAEQVVFLKKMVGDARKALAEERRKLDIAQRRLRTLEAKTMVSASFDARMDRAYGVSKLHDRIEQLEAELAHEREKNAPKKTVSRCRELMA